MPFPFIGREREITLIQHSFEDCRSGEPRVVAITGPPEITTPDVILSSGIVAPKEKMTAQSKHDEND